MKKTITAVLTSGELQGILAKHFIAMAELDVVPDSPMSSELMAVASKDAAGNVEINQYRIQIEVEVERESWRG